MPDSFLSRIKKALAAPKPAPHHLQYRNVIPLRTRIWESIRPPAKVPSTALPMTRGQRRLLLSVAAIVVPGLIAWGIVWWVQSAPDRAYAKLQEGIPLAAAGKIDLAIEKYSDAISIWPHNARAYLERGNAYSISSRIDQAKRDWDKALELDPQLAEAYVARGTQFRIEGKNQEALADLERAISLRANGDAYYQQGETFASLGKQQQAIEAYTRAIGLLPTSPFVYYSRAAAKKAIGDIDGSEADRNAAFKLSHASPDAGH